jgi:hypothetical protein
MVLRNLEQVFGIAFDDVTPSSRTSRLAQPAPPPSPGPADGTGERPAEVESNNRRGTRRLFRLIF